MSEENNTVKKYDRIRGQMQDVCLFTRPSTIRTVQTITGKAETFVIETGRHPELGDYVFIEHIDESGTVTRVYLPPKASNAVASQRESLTARRRSIASKVVAQARKDRGELPGFMKK